MDFQRVRDGLDFHALQLTQLHGLEFELEAVVVNLPGTGSGMLFRLELPACESRSSFLLLGLSQTIRASSS